jgi:glycosyltransferase involved in cell wall biosynthesis
VRLKIGATHPIQYQAPWFRALAARGDLELEVGFAWLPDRAAQGAGFGVEFAWDVPLLDGYRWVELARSRRRADLTRFAGLRLRAPSHWLRGTTDVLLVTGWNSLALVQLARAAKRAGIPVIARGDSRGDRPRAAWRRALLRAFLRTYAAFLVVGERNREFYRSLGVAEERLHPAPHFVDNERFAAAADRARSEAGGVRNGWALRAEDLVVAFVGKLIPEKNVDELLEAFAVAAPRVPAMRLVLVGDGPERQRLGDRASALGIEVRWAGFANQSELPRVYAAIDLLVLPSRSESWGLVVNEAMACGVPVIASDRVGCVPDLVHPGRTGEVYRSGHPAELAERIVRLAGDPVARKALGDNGRRLVRSGYSVERAVEGTMAALRAVARAA